MRFMRLLPENVDSLTIMGNLAYILVILDSLFQLNTHGAMISLYKVSTENLTNIYSSLFKIVL